MLSKVSSLSVAAESLRALLSFADPLLTQLFTASGTFWAFGEFGILGEATGDLGGEERFLGEFGRRGEFASLGEFCSVLPVEDLVGGLCWDVREE